MRKGMPGKCKQKVSTIIVWLPSSDRVGFRTKTLFKAKEKMLKSTVQNKAIIVVTFIYIVAKFRKQIS